MTDAAQRLWGVVEPYLAAEAVELDDIEIRGGKGGLVRIVVDAEGGVDVDRIADLARGISRLIEENDAGLATSSLEVSSPGLERKLRRRRHYEKAIGRDVKVRTAHEVGGSHSHRGTLLRAGDTSFTIGVGGEEQTIAYGDVVTATTVFEWKAAPKPGGGKPKPAGARGSAGAQGSAGARGNV